MHFNWMRMIWWELIWELKCKYIQSALFQPMVKSEVIKREDQAAAVVTVWEYLTVPLPRSVWMFLSPHFLFPLNILKMFVSVLYSLIKSVIIVIWNQKAKKVWAAKWNIYHHLLRFAPGKQLNQPFTLCTTTGGKFKCEQQVQRCVTWWSHGEQILQRSIRSLQDRMRELKAPKVCVKCKTCFVSWLLMTGPLQRLLSN